MIDRVLLDNAQSGGPQIRFLADGELVGKVYPRAVDQEMQYLDFPGGVGGWKLSDFPEHDGIVLWDAEVHAT